MALLDNDELLRATGHRIRYAPRGAALELFHNRDPELVIAGPKGTGKSLAVLHKQHLVLSKYPGARYFMARKTRTSMTNSCLETFQRQVLAPPDRVHFHKQDQQFIYPNGSVYAVIGLDNIDRLNSSNWDGGFIQEVTEATERDWEIASACIRFGTVPYKQLIGDCNPDKPTHWMKKKVDQGLVKMLISIHKDNPRLWNEYGNDWSPEGVQYIDRLKRMTGVRFSRLYLGNWVAAEGVVYEEWDPNVHMLSYSDLPPDWVEWDTYWAIDFGFTHPFVWQKWKEDPKGRLYLVRQIYRTKSLVEDLAEEIMELEQGLDVPKAIICDHDAEGRATFERHTGYLTLPAYKLIQPGIQAVQARLKPNWDKRPGIFILRDSLVGVDHDLEMEGKPTCTEAEFDGYVWDEKINRLVNSKKDEVPVDKDNHGMDPLRYIVAFVDSLGDDPEDIEGIMTFEDEVSISPY